jgi:hypothetical protein
MTKNQAEKILKDNGILGRNKKELKKALYILENYVNLWNINVITAVKTMLIY